MNELQTAQLPSLLIQVSLHRIQVSLHRESAADSTLSLASDDLIQAGMEVRAYFSEEDDSQNLHSKIQAEVGGVLEDPSAVSVEYASHCSTVIYLTVLKTPESTTMEQLLGVFKGMDPKPKVFLSSSSSIFEAKEEGMAAAQI